MNRDIIILYLKLKVERIHLHKEVIQILIVQYKVEIQTILHQEYLFLQDRIQHQVEVTQFQVEAVHQVILHRAEVIPMVHHHSVGVQEVQEIQVLKVMEADDNN